MANYYARTAGGTWTTAATWSTDDVLQDTGAAAGSAPTAGDNCFLVAGSGQVTTAAGAVCRSLDATGYVNTLTIANSTTSLTIGDASGGALTLVSGMTLTISGSSSTIRFNSTSNNGGTGWGVTSAGKTMPSLSFIGVGGKWVLQDNLSMSTNILLLSAGTLDTNNKTITGGRLTLTGTTTRTITFGSSAITLAGSSGLAWDATAITNLTTTANTAQVTLTGSGDSFNGGNNNWNGMSLIMTGGQKSINTPGTFYDVSFTGTAVKTDSLTVNGALISTNTLVLAGNSISNRILIKSITAGTAQTITAASITVSNADFQDITGAGAGSWNLSSITGGSGDCGGNSGITFSTPATSYAVATSWDSTSSWASTSGGSGGTGRIPLPQDTARLDANSPAGTYSPVTGGRYGTVDCTGFTRTLDMSNATMSWFGSLIFSSGMTLSGTTANTLAGRGINDITTNGKTVTFRITIAAVTGTYKLQSNFTSNISTTSAFIISSGRLDLNGRSFTLSGSTSKLTISANGTLLAGNSTVTLSGATSDVDIDGTLEKGNFIIGRSTSGIFWDTATGCVILNKPNITLTSTTSNSRTFQSVASKVWGALTNTAVGTGRLEINAVSNTFDSINISGAAKGLRFTSTQTITVINDFNVFGTAGNLVTLDTTSSTATISKVSGLVSCDYLSITNWTASGGADFYAGANSTDVSGNSGWIFSAGPSSTRPPAESTLASGTSLNPSGLNREAIVPNGDATITGWTTHSGGTSNLYATIDEIPASDSDYIKSNLSI